MRLRRRTFLKGAGAGGAALAGRRFFARTPEAVLASSTAKLTEEWIPTTCWIGKQECGILARKVDGRVVKFEGHPDNPRNLGRLCPKGQAQITTLYDPNRITTPLVRTNVKGVPGEWRRATWDEAMDIVAERLGSTLAEDPLLTAWVLGRPKVKTIYAEAFPAATGLMSYGRRGQDCAGPSEDAALATWGFRTPMTPDLRRCRYLICYWNLTQAGGPELCQITFPREVADAKARGMKVVAINPHARSVAHMADEWVPIKPGTDMTFWLAVINVLLAEGFVDEPFLRSHTNAAALVGADGAILKSDGVDLVWDESKKAAAAVSKNSHAALFGTFEVDGQEVKPALQVLKDHVEGYTPEWASDVCGVPAEQIRRIALELGENASIGSTTLIDGVEVPLRPVAFGLHGTSVKFQDGLQTSRTILLAFMILGAIEAAGSAHFADFEPVDPAATHELWLAAAANAEPQRLDLGDSAWFPMGSSGYIMFPETVNDPEKYGLTRRAEDMAVLASYVNPVLSTRPVDRAIDAWSRFGFVAYITPYLSATPDISADVILPCGTLDKLEGPLGPKTMYTKGASVRQPVMAPLGESRGEIEILIDLCGRLGKLTGEAGFVARLNEYLELAEPNLLPVDEAPTTESILDAWSRTKLSMGLDELRKVGVVTSEVSAEEMYLNSGELPFGGVRGHFYLDVFPKIGALMQEAGVPEELWRRYTAYPTWTEPPIEASPEEFDLYLMDHKRIELKQTRSLELPLLAELVPDNPLVMNAAEARRRGLADEDEVVVESHHPGTGETRSIRTVLRTSNGIRPDTVSITHHARRVDDPTANALFFYGDGMWDIGSGWFSHVKVKVQKA